MPRKTRRLCLRGKPDLFAPEKAAPHECPPARENRRDELPDRYPAPRVPAPPATRWTDTSGCSTWKSGRRGISQRIRSVGSQETTSAGVRATSLISRTAFSTRPKPSRTAAASFRPASVRKTRRLRRSNSAMPRSSSIRRTARLIAPCVKCSASAARLKLSSLAAASKHRSAASGGSRGACICE